MDIRRRRAGPTGRCPCFSVNGKAPVRAGTRGVLEARDAPGGAAAFLKC